jgi:Cu(I)/Ag(I) efflux system membrane fusion protein
MKHQIPAVLAALLLAVGAGYWLGKGKVPEGTHRAGAGDTAIASAPAAASAPTATPARKLLYYRNPMGLPDTSPVPKKDPMGMDYIPVYEGAEEPASAAGQIVVSTEKVQKLGVRSEPAAMRALGQVVRAAGRIEVDERRVFAVAPKFEGWVERLHVNATGQPVAKGQPLFEVYSPELVSAQREYSITSQGALALKDAGPEAQAGMRQLAESSLLRLKNWDISDEQVAALARTGEARRTITFRSPVSGIVTEKKALQGMRFMPGETLYQIADLSSVWVVADVFEQDIALVRPGARASVKINAYPDRLFQATITYIYPTMKAETRTVPVRLELANPGGLLKPAMYAQVELTVSGAGKSLSIPTSAVIDSGTRQIALVQLAEGRFEPRELKLGARSDTHVQVLSGISEGENVVVAANFLIDAESNLRAAVGGFGHSSHGSAAKPGAGEPASGPASAPGDAKSATIGHQAVGTLVSVDAKAGTASVKHGPIASLKWPAMTMDFALANPALVAGVKPGTSISFEIVERKPGEWVITRLTPNPAANDAPARPSKDGEHSGH